MEREKDGLLGWLRSIPPRPAREEDGLMKSFVTPEVKARAALDKKDDDGGIAGRELEYRRSYEPPKPKKQEDGLMKDFVTPEVKAVHLVAATRPPAHGRKQKIRGPER